MALRTTTRVRIGLLVAAAAAGLLNPPAAIGQGQVAKLTASDAAANDFFGNTAVDGDIAVETIATRPSQGAGPRKRGGRRGKGGGDGLNGTKVNGHVREMQGVPPQPPSV